MKQVIPIVLAAAWAAAAGSQRPEELSRRADELYGQARYAEAEPLYRRALEAWAHGAPAALRNRAVDKCSLGALLRAEGRYREAEKWLTEALAELESAGTAAEMARARYSLAALYRDEGDLTRAGELARRAMETAPEPMRGNARLILGSVYVEQKRFGDAEPVVMAALEGADGAQAMTAYTLLTTMAMGRGEYGEAEDFARKALYFGRAALPAGHQSLAAAWNNLAQACRFEGRYLEAERAYREAIDTWEESLGPWHPDLAKGLSNFAAFYHERGREAGAEVLYARAAAIYEKTFGRDHVVTLVARNALADVLRAERRFTESDKLGRATLAALENVLPPGDPRLVRALRNRACLLRETRRPKEAAVILSSLRLQ